MSCFDTYVNEKFERLESRIAEKDAEITRLHNRASALDAVVASRGEALADAQHEIDARDEKIRDLRSLLAEARGLMDVEECLDDPKAWADARMRIDEALS